MEGEGDSGPEFSNSVELTGEKESSRELLVHLSQMVNNPDFSDVVFVCNDGKRVHALRKLLEARSGRLRSMFMNGVVESHLSQIKLPKISSEVLLSVLEFLYTGTLYKYQPLNWSICCEMVIAARFFILPQLEMMIGDFMCDQISGDLTQAAGQLSEAVGFKSSVDNTNTDRVFLHLVRILKSDWSDSVYVRSLSENAFAFVLENSKGFHRYKFSFTEYLRFRQVIRWWIYQGDFGNGVIEELLNFLAPDEKGALCLCRDRQTFIRVLRKLRQAY